LPGARAARAPGRPLVAGLFVSSALLSVVSFYTTQQGMALYLSPWFSFLASLGIQSAMLLVAWLVGVAAARRGLLVAVYAVTATVSIGFSYVSLHTWFASRERPAAIERALYDRLELALGRSQELLTAAVAEAQGHVLALEELTSAEKAHGHISRATDRDPFLAGVRAAVAREAESYAAAYPEGQGEGVRYTAFERHTALARQALGRMLEAQRSLAAFRAGLKPLDSSEQQLGGARRVMDAVPWSDVREALHAEVEVPVLPAYTDFVDRTASGQEDLVVAFEELVAAPRSRHVVALALAAFIDVVVFLLAYASGPFFFGDPEARWLSAAAALDAAEPQLFARGLLRKAAPGPQGLPRVEEKALTPGERQLCLVLASNGMAAAHGEDGRRGYLLDSGFHRRLVESLAEPGLALRASTAGAAEPAAG
jgi:hypothetical protein